MIRLRMKVDEEVRGVATGIGEGDIVTDIGIGADGNSYRLVG